MNTTKTETLAHFCAAVAQDLDLLATLHHAELDDATLTRLRTAGFPDLGLRLLGHDAGIALAAMRESLAELPNPLPPELRDELAVDYAAIYLTYAYHASPCESVWLDQENLCMQAPMFEVRAFYGLFNLAAANWRARSDDHLVVELSFLAALFRDEHPQALHEAARFLDTHLLRWLPLFAQRVASRCATPFYAAASLLTAAYCDELRDVLAQLLGAPRPTPEAIEAAMRPRPAPVPLQPYRQHPGVAPSW